MYARKLIKIRLPCSARYTRTISEWYTCDTESDIESDTEIRWSQIKHFLIARQASTEKGFLHPHFWYFSPTGNRLSLTMWLRLAFQFIRINDVFTRNRKQITNQLSTFRMTCLGDVYLWQVERTYWWGFNVPNGKRPSKRTFSMDSHEKKKLQLHCARATSNAISMKFYSISLFHAPVVRWLCVHECVAVSPTSSALVIDTGVCSSSCMEDKSARVCELTFSLNSSAHSFSFKINLFSKLYVRRSSGTAGEHH